MQTEGPFELFKLTSENNTWLIYPTDDAMISGLYYTELFLSDGPPQDSTEASFNGSIPVIYELYINLTVIKGDNDTTVYQLPYFL